MKRALIVSSTSASASAREVLRISNWAMALEKNGWEVDVLVDSSTTLTEAALGDGSNVHKAVNWPIAGGTCRFFMVLAAVRLVARNKYSLLVGVGGGAEIVRAADRATLAKFKYVADVISSAPAGKVLKHAAAVTAIDSTACEAVASIAPRARLSILEEPHEDIGSADWTFAMFAEAAGRVAEYAISRGAT
ncbi:MAG: hypothetical protein IJ802_06255 [Kiritimatiellae bacterium]|nr:hypothetical protein [Kiritimatiellia bacterium]